MVHLVRTIDGVVNCKDAEERDTEDHVDARYDYLTFAKLQVPDLNETGWLRYEQNTYGLAGVIGQTKALFDAHKG